MGGVFDWIPVHYDTFSGPDTNFAGGSLGVKLTWDVPRTVPVLIRPGIGYRFAMVPGIEVACVADGSGYACGGTDQCGCLPLTTSTAYSITQKDIARPLQHHPRHMADYRDDWRSVRPRRQSGVSAWSEGADCGQPDWIAERWLPADRYGTMCASVVRNRLA